MGGKIRLADCVAPIVDRYQFSSFPQKIEDFDLDKGLKFGSGKAGDSVIDSLVIFDGAMFLDTLSSTDDSREILFGMLEWGREALGLSYTSDTIRKWGFISQLVFYTDFPLLSSISSPLQKLAQKTSNETEKFFSGLKYEPMSIAIGHDPNVRKHGIAGLTIQHRVNTLFSENKYFSEAPLPTDLHIKFLQEFETDVLESLK
jgi:hypothetical protein